MAEKNSSHIQPTPARVSSHGRNNTSLATLDTRLAHLRELGENWDTYGGIPPSEAAIILTRQVLEALTVALGSHHNAIPPVIAPTSDGGVLLEWNTKHADLEVEIGNAGCLSYLITSHNADGDQYDEHDEAPVQEIVDLVSGAIRS